MTEPRHRPTSHADDRAKRLAVVVRRALLMVLAEIEREFDIAPTKNEKMVKSPHEREAMQPLQRNTAGR